MAKSAAIKAVPSAPAEAPQAAETAKPKGKKRLLLVLILLLLLGGGGGGGWWWWKNKNAKASKDGKEAPAAAEVKKKHPPQFVPLESFTVNLQDKVNEHYLQVAMVLEVENSATGDSIKLYMPLIRNRVLLLLSSQLSEGISTLEGKQKLAAAILVQVREPLPADLKKGVEGVHFSAFVIQ